jgi:hypothetical protein
MRNLTDTFYYPAASDERGAIGNMKGAFAAFVGDIFKEFEGGIQVEAPKHREGKARAFDSDGRQDRGDGIPTDGSQD